MGVGLARFLSDLPAPLYPPDPSFAWWLPHRLGVPALRVLIELLTLVSDMVEAVCLSEADPQASVSLGRAPGPHAYGLKSHFLCSRSRHIFKHPSRIFSNILQLAIYVFRHAKQSGQHERERSITDHGDYGQHSTFDTSRQVHLSLLAASLLPSHVLLILPSFRCCSAR